MCMCVCVCVCVCVCQNEERCPKEKQARQARFTSHNDKKIAEQEDAHFLSRVSVTLTSIGENGRNYLLSLHNSKSTFFRS